MIPNHYGYGLRNDELPYAHKIPPGGYWRDLPMEEIMKYWNGVYPRSGGCTNGLRRRSWDEPGGTITTNPFQKLSCQLHPGTDIAEGGTRVYNVIPQREPNDLTVTELFAGGGLMAAGLHAAGYEIIWANDFDKSACAAYRHNHGDYIVQGDITAIDVDSIPDADIIAGGPPCQDYSVAGEGAGEDGERGKLVWTYLSIIEKKQPKAFIFENVKGLIQKAHKHTFDALLEAFNEIGYKVSHKVVNAWDHGIAQKRERVFIVGIREDLGFKFVFPDPIPEDYRTQLLRDVIGDLPEPGMKPKNHNPEKQLPQGYQNVIDGKTKTNYGNGIKINDGTEPASTLLARYWEKGPPSEVYLQPENHEPRELSDQAIEYLHSKNGRALKKHRPPTLDEPGQTIISNIAKGVPFGLHYPDNHDPQELSDKALDYIDRNWEHRGSRVKEMDEPGSTVSAVYAKGVPYGLFYPDNHEGTPLSPMDAELAKHIPNGGDWKDVPYDQLPERLKRIHDDMKKHHSPSLYKKADWEEPAGTISATMSPTHAQALAPDGIPNHERKDISDKAIEGYERRGGQGGFGYRVNNWDEPSPTIFGRIANEGKAFVHPSALENHDGHLFDNVNPNWTYEQTMRPASWEKPAATISSHSRCEGIHPDYLENHDRWRKLGTDDEVLPDLPERMTTFDVKTMLPNAYHQNYSKSGNEEPSLTISAIGYPKPHPKKPRRFTVRECLRIQSVPDWYVFPESISLSAQYRVVGNGVASRVAYLLGIALADQLRGATATEEGQIDLYDILDRRLPRERKREGREEDAG